MEIQLNGQPITLPAPCTVADLLSQEHLAGPAMAVEINGQIVIERQYATRALCHGDRVEVIHALGAR